MRLAHQQPGQEDATDPDTGREKEKQKTDVNVGLRIKVLEVGKPEPEKWGAAGKK